MYLLTQPENGISTPEIMRQPGISYNAAWRMKRKLLHVMKERDDSTPRRQAWTRHTGQDPVRRGRADQRKRSPDRHALHQTDRRSSPSANAS